MISFKGADREQVSFMPHNLNDWLPEDHLARFVVDIVGKMDLRHIYLNYSGKGSIPYDPKLLLSLLFYGYSTGIFSSRKIETATYDSVAFRFIAGNHHPDHDTVSSFRKKFLPELKGWFKEILLIGNELGLIKLGNIFIDGTKVQANASKHKAMSYKRMKELEVKLECEIEQLMTLGEEQDKKEDESTIDIPNEIKRRNLTPKKRLVKHMKSEQGKNPEARNPKSLHQSPRIKINTILPILNLE
jgi:transposase